MTHDQTALKLQKNKDKRIKNGHLWIFSNEIEPVKEQPDPGSVVTIHDTNNKFLGTGFYHPNSLIAVRILSKNRITVNAAFFQKRIQQAIDARKSILSHTNALRLIHAESDGLPGLIVDSYDNGLVLQILSAGMENHRNTIISVIKELINPRFIIVRNDHIMREREGLDQEKRIIAGDSNDIPLEINENSLRYIIDPLEGQKTGFYIDQRDNRLVFRKYVSKGDRVLDAFCHLGGFAINAAFAGASDVLAIDNSTPVIEQAMENFRINNAEQTITTRKADLLQYLPEMAKEKTRFDVINLDPPNFAVNRKSVGPALRGYRKIHRAALEMLNPGGILATSSCSHHITKEAFLESVTRACKDTGRRVHLVYQGSNPEDHPVLPEMPETEYLKFFIFRVIDIE